MYNNQDLNSTLDQQQLQQFTLIMSEQQKLQWMIDSQFKDLLQGLDPDVAAKIKQKHEKIVEQFFEYSKKSFQQPTKQKIQQSYQEIILQEISENSPSPSSKSIISQEIIDSEEKEELQSWEKKKATKDKREGQFPKIQVFVKEDSGQYAVKDLKEQKEQE